MKTYMKIQNQPTITLYKSERTRESEQNETKPECYFTNKSQ